MITTESWTRSPFGSYVGNVSLSGIPFVPEIDTFPVSAAGVRAVIRLRTLTSPNTDNIIFLFKYSST